MSQQSTLDFILKQKKEAEEQRNKRSYKSYIETLLSQLQSGMDFVTSTVQAPEPNEDGTFLCLREPESFLDLFDDVSNSQKECRELFSQLVQQRDERVIEQIVNAGDKDSPMWFNSTANGLNLRPGLQNNKNAPPSGCGYNRLG